MLEYKTARPLYTWVQPYYASQLLDEDQLSSGMVDYCSLQWWGTKYNTIEELQPRALIEDSVAYIRDSGASSVLCLTNVAAENPLDKEGMNLSRYLETACLDRALKFVDLYGFDGLDLDLESSADTQDNIFHEELVRACEYLKDRLGERKLITCTFASPFWKTPNTTVWPFLKSDIIISMGYDDVGADFVGDTWSSYREQSKLGRDLSEVYQGMPGWLDTWKGRSFEEHLAAAIETSDGIALWDIRDLGKVRC